MAKKGAFLVLVLIVFSQLYAAEPVIDCRTKFNPTEDKPQSKVWQAQGQWWAWLPYETFGGRIWQRTDSGWTAVSSLDKMTLELPGKADIWSNGDTVVAALVQDNKLATACIAWDQDSGGYLPCGIPVEWESNSSVAETVTLNRAPDGRFVVSYPDSGQIMVAVLEKSDRLKLLDSSVICENTYHDDISLTTRLGNDGPLCVVWSDQEKETLFYREFQPSEENPFGWGETKIIAEGNLTADDHLNACIPPDSADLPLQIIASKTSLDTEGEPLLALRVLDRDGNWTTHDFAVLTDKLHPSRPLLVWWNDMPVCFYTCYGQSGEGNYIFLKYFSPGGLEGVGEEQPILGPLKVLNDVTGTKARVNSDTLLILASDIWGKVYEITLNK